MLSSTLRRRALALATPFVLLLAACGGSDDPTATVSFVEPAEGAAVAGGVDVAMTAEGISIEEAGEVHDGAGHFHVIADAGCVAAGTAVPSDADHVHLGDGQPEGTIYLEPGPYELCLQAGDGAHVALDVTDTVTVDVGITDRDQWCAVIGDANELFAANDDDEIEFPVRQVGYENARRLLAQLSEALDQVDADARDEVASELDFGRTWATAYVESDDYQGATAALVDVFEGEGAPQSGGPGSTWIRDNCDVAVAGTGL